MAVRTISPLLHSETQLMPDIIRFWEGPDRQMQGRVERWVTEEILFIWETALLGLSHEVQQVGYNHIS